MWNLAIRAPVFITMCVVTVLVLGTVFFFQTGLDLLPDISVPVVVVQTIYPGASAEDVERDVSKPLEDAFASLNYVEAVRSTSQEGVSVVTLEFNMDYSARQASADVRERLATLTSFAGSRALALSLIPATTLEGALELQQFTREAGLLLASAGYAGPSIDDRVPDLVRSISAR